jgi:hypothetical protein
MTVVEKIIEHLKSMPEPAQVEVLHFVESLKIEEGRRSRRGEDYEWSEFSLAAAMRGIEEEQSPYLIEDIKERF